MVCIILEVSKNFHANFNFDETGRVLIWLFLCDLLLLMAKTVLVLFWDPISPTNVYCWTNIDKKLDQLVGPNLVSKIVGLGNLAVTANDHPSSFDEEMKENHGNPIIIANGILNSESDFDSGLNEPFGNEVYHQALYTQDLSLEENQTEIFCVPSGMAYDVPEISPPNSIHKNPVDASTTPAP